MEAPNNMILPALILIPFIAGFMLVGRQARPVSTALYRVNRDAGNPGVNRGSLAERYLCL